MRTLNEARADLLTALGGVQGVRPYEDPGATLDPPAALLGPPSVTWDTGCLTPSEARFLVYLVSQVDDRALERLADLLPEVALAVDQLSWAAVIRADPGSYDSGGVQLPAYLIQIEVSL